MDNLVQFLIATVFSAGETIINVHRRPFQALPGLFLTGLFAVAELPVTTVFGFSRTQPLQTGVVHRTRIAIIASGSVRLVAAATFRVTQSGRALVAVVTQRVVASVDNLIQLFVAFVHRAFDTVVRVGCQTFDTLAGRRVATLLSIAKSPVAAIYGGPHALALNTRIFRSAQIAVVALRINRFKDA